MSVIRYRGLNYQLATHRSLLNDDVLDDQLLDGKVLRLGVGLGILEKVEDDLHRLDRPSTC